MTRRGRVQKSSDGSTSKYSRPRGACCTSRNVAQRVMPEGTFLPISSKFRTSPASRAMRVVGQCFRVHRDRVRVRQEVGPQRGARAFECRTNAPARRIPAGCGRRPRGSPSTSAARHSFTGSKRSAVCIANACRLPHIHLRRCRTASAYAAGPDSGPSLRRFFERREGQGPRAGLTRCLSEVNRAQRVVDGSHAETARSG